MADQVKLQCPSCHGEVTLGDVECPHCGVNLKSGESYEERVKQAKGKDVHPEHFGGRISAAVAFALTLVLFAGFMWERAVRNVFADKYDTFSYAVGKLQEIDDMIARAHRQEALGEAPAAQKTFADAARATNELIDWLRTTDDSIEPKVPYAKENTQQGTRPWRTEKDYNRPLAKRQLKNLRAKAELRLKSIPAA
jgi:hypothetical protein